MSFYFCTHRYFVCFLLNKVSVLSVQDGTVRAWDCETGNEISSFDCRSWLQDKTMWPALKAHGHPGEPGRIESVVDVSGGDSCNSQPADVLAISYLPDHKLVAVGFER